MAVLQTRVLILLNIIIFLLVPTMSRAQQPTAAISSFSGVVRVSLQGQEPVAATTGMTLQAGDAIQTEEGAQVVFTLSEGSELRLGQNTRLELSELFQQPKTGARKSHIKLAYGRLRALLSGGHQEKGSSFDIETPNAVAGVKFSRPEIEVSYDPATNTTVIVGLTVPTIVQNLLTNERKRMEAAHQAVIKQEFIWITPFAPEAALPSEKSEQPAAESLSAETEAIPPAVQQTFTRVQTLWHSRQIAGGTVSPAPVSSGGRPETSQSPGPGSPTGLSRPRVVTIYTEEE